MQTLAWEFCSTFLRVEQLHKLFGIILHERFIFFPIYLDIHLFIYLFNHLLISVWAHGYLFYSLGCHPIVSFIYPHSSYSALVFEHFFTLWHSKMLQDHHVFSLPLPWSQQNHQRALGWHYQRLMFRMMLLKCHKFFVFNIVLAGSEFKEVSNPNVYYHHIRWCDGNKRWCLGDT